MRLDQLDGIDGVAGHAAGLFHGHRLPIFIGRGDVFALAITGFTVTGDDPVDGVVVAQGIPQTLENHRPRSLAHDKTVGALVKRK